MQLLSKYDLLFNSRDEEKFLTGHAPPVPPGPLLPKQTVTVTASQSWLLRPRGCEGRDYRTLSGAEDTNMPAFIAQVYWEDENYSKRRNVPKQTSSHCLTEF